MTGVSAETPHAIARNVSYYYAELTAWPGRRLEDVPPLSAGRCAIPRNGL
jgi:hypothetical protein